MNIGEKYQLDLKVCPTEIINRATYRFGKWMEDSGRINSRPSDNQKSISLFVSGYDGSSVESPTEWKIDFPIHDFLLAETGTWLVPIDTNGSFALCIDELQATGVILDFAEDIWQQTGKAPYVEAVRLDDLNGKRLRIYSFWFPFRGQEPIVESQPVT